eukprot:CAMPEP_0171473904 /NCGR_PEP_ID=MMETSP0946-20130122/2116_1 /TAXON_ID=109269 /ORGANISM="Vaucheria litorea, Strain CCMP2940" /LENGTH=176 /DNA_ID=CAMNT_0012003751 /DNA_START=28 /DNA_END=555 /DNA_ORIENTATION=-
MAEVAWMNEYNKIRTQLLKATNSDTLSSRALVVDSVKTGLNMLGKQLDSMEKKPSDYGLTRAKVLRRRGMLDNLDRQYKSAQAVKNQNLTTETTTNSSNSRLMQQRATMKEHGSLIEELGAGVSRLNQKSKAINEEANLHLSLLDGMGDDIEKANRGLIEETEHAEKVRQKNKTFW